MRRSLLVVVITLLLAPVASGIEVQFARRPALSPDGKRIAFCWRGDIWVVDAAGGRARRLTVHPAYDTRPVWSPDGTAIAFGSDRFGNYDVFVMSADGGLPMRLTYHSSSDLPTCYTPDGKALIVTSSRHKGIDRRSRFYRLPVAGGTPRLLFRAVGSDPRLSPDGKQLVFSRGVVSWYRKNYRGSASHDVWLYDMASERFTQLTRFPGNDDSPCFGPRGEAVYFRSDRKGLADLWRIDLATRKLSQVSHSRTQGIRLPDVARSAPLAVYERWGELYTLDLSSGTERRVAVSAPADERDNRIVRTSYRGRGVSEFAVSPDGKAVAFVIQGEVFVKELAASSKRAIQLTHTLAARERGLTWGGKGRLVFMSDRDGNDQLYMVEATGDRALWQRGRRRLQQLTKGEAPHRAPAFDATGEQLAYVRGAGDLVLRQMKTGAETVLVRGWNLHHHAFSPDGRWIAYGRYDDEYNSDIWLKELPNGRPVNVTSHPDHDYSFAWSESGRALVFASDRGKDTEIGHVWLRRVDAARAAEEWREHFKALGKALAARRAKRLAPPARADAKKKAGPKKQAGPVGKQPPAKKAKKAETARKGARAVVDPLYVRVDRREIFLRVRLLSKLAGNESNPAISPDGQTILFVGQRGKTGAIYRVQHDGSGARVLLDNAGSVSGLRFGPTGRKVWFLGSGGVISTLDPASGRRGKVDFEARLTSDREGIRRQKFEECWRLIRDRFYDGRYHGVDWGRMRRQYRKLALSTRTDTDFNYVIKLMLGELNASHLGISGPRRGGVREQTGELGLDFDPAHTGRGLKVARVLPRGPSAGKARGIRPGDLLVAVDDQELSGTRNLYALLVDTVGQPVRLAFEREGKRREVTVRPVSTRADGGLRYQDWVARRRWMVDRLSKGKLGYVHIQGMNWPSLERFERDLYARANGKQGLLIDVRYNGGGWTTDMLLVMLQTRPHAYTVGRGGGKGYPQGRRPFYTWQKPVGLLCNEMSFSNAEIFSHAFRNLGLGPVVGVPTYGAVISTGSATLIDGARFRIPGRGWYTLPGGKNMDMHGARPDHLVPQTPTSENAGTDPQLARAVKELQKGKKKK